MKSALPLLLFALAGCVTSSAEPMSVHPSAKGRQAIVDCLLDRFPGRVPRLVKDARSTTIRFEGPLGNAGLITTTTDQGTGSLTELRGSMLTAGLTSLKTCF